MTDQRQDFDMTALTAKTLYFALTDESGSPLDLSAASATWRMSQTPDGAALLEKGTANPPGGISISDPLNGKLNVVIGNDDVAEAGLYWHFLFVTIAGVRTSVAAGRAVVMPALGAAN